MDRYIGIDVHSASCTAVVLSAKGKRLSSTVLETNGRSLVEYLRLIPGTRHLIIEEGTHAAWLYEILSPHVHEMVVMSVPKSKGQKNDKLDAFGLAEKLPIVVTPYRFPNKRMFWTYCGLGVVMRSSSDWIQAADGSWSRANTEKTRGLNFNHNHTLKKIFKGAATTVVGQKRPEEPIFQHYLTLLESGTNPNLAKLTIARQIASVTLSLWRSGEEYDGKKMKKQ